MELVECCPPGGVVCDPFMGSGTTAIACRKKGRRFIGFEENGLYIPIIERRLRDAATPLFAEVVP